MTRLIMFGCGALGSQIALHLSSTDNSFLLIDDDRVSENNVVTGTSAYYMHQIGAQKIDCLSEMLWLKGRSISETYPNTVNHSNINQIMRIPIHGSGEMIIVDTFDNIASRRIVQNFSPPLIPVLHAGVSINRTGMVAWEHHFPLGSISDDTDRHTNPVCTNQLGASILRLTSVIAVGAIEIFLATGQQKNFLITESLQIKELRI